MELTNNHPGLKHGQFKVQIYTNEETVEDCIINNLTQEEMADNWQLVLPEKQKVTTTHHFSVYLSQLPPHLWKLLRTNVDANNSEHYETIYDNIYQYSVKMSKFDDDLRALYNLVTASQPDLKQITQLVEELEKQRVKGWLMIRAKKLLDN